MQQAIASHLCIEGPCPMPMFPLSFESRRCSACSPANFRDPFLRRPIADPVTAPSAAAEPGRATRWMRAEFSPRGSAEEQTCGALFQAARTRSRAWERAWGGTEWWQAQQQVHLSLRSLSNSRRFMDAYGFIRVYTLSRIRLARGSRASLPRLQLACIQ